ncbi:MAG: hypothetical protein ACQESR_15120 [Planctomycetota bacterium]
MLIVDPEPKEKAGACRDSAVSEFALEPHRGVHQLFSRGKFCHGALRITFNWDADPDAGLGGGLDIATTSEKAKLVVSGENTRLCSVCQATR